jgi:hypothetical protein
MIKNDAIAGERVDGWRFNRPVSVATEMIRRTVSTVIRITL